jgi:N-acetylmuramoyl-L-alanine amidase-like protein/flagellar hook capping protein FlgD
MKVLLATIAAMLAAPAAASAVGSTPAGPTMTVRDVPLQEAGRSLAAATPRFNLVAVHWRGTGAIDLRTRSGTGAWSAWHPVDDDAGPDAGSSENRLRTWRLGSPVWTGAADAIRFRTHGRVTRLRAYFIWSPPERTSSRLLALANAPPIIPRLSWGADESIRRANPKVAPAIHFAVVHHTAGSNTYTAAQSAAIVRGIELYHVKGNGWNDIGYNFLVDKYGQVFEGRFGGVDRAVVGAHSLGFNDGSVGVAVLGDYTGRPISAAAKSALEQLLAWRLDLAHIDPLSTLTWLSGGNPRFPSRIAVVLRAISGHRDTNFTDCPGDALYAELPQIAQDVALLGAPKVYAPLAAGKLGGPVHFGARLTSALPWTVTVNDSTGAVAAQGSGAGTVVDWTWDATTASPQRYTWSIATAGARAASGAIGAGSLALAVQNAVAKPSLLSPGGDPADDSMTVSYTLTAPATVTATLVDANGQVLSTLFAEPKTPGAQSFTFTSAAGIYAGSYTIQLAAVAPTGTSAAASVPITIDDTLDAFTWSAVRISALTHGRATLSFNLTRGPVSAELHVLQGATVVATPWSGPLDAGPQTLGWDGTLDDGTAAPDGTYVLSLSIADEFTTFARTAPVTLDSTPPSVTVLSYRTMRFRTSEPVLLTLVVGARRYTRTLTRPGTVSFWLRQKPRAYRLIASDTAGNVSVVRYRRPE